MRIKSPVGISLFTIIFCVSLVGCKTGTPQAKSSSFCFEVADKIPNNSNITVLEAYNICMDRELDKRNEYRDDSEIAVDLAVNFLLDILSSE